MQLMILGAMPIKLNVRRIEAWKSEVFEVVGKNRIERDLENVGANEKWEFKDADLERHMDHITTQGADFTIAIVNLKLEQNYYSRRVSGNRIIFSLNQIGDYLKQENIPLENAILRSLYLYSLVYLRDKKIPSLASQKITHDETRGCLFDMNGIHREIVISAQKPRLCDQCAVELKSKGVDRRYVDATQSELRRLRKPLYHRVLCWVQEKPLTALVISSVYAIFLGAIGSLIASYIWDRITHRDN